MKPTKKELDAFAEALANGKSPAAAATAAGFTVSFGAPLLDYLIATVGPSQAR